MAKIRKNYRLSEEVISMMDTLLPYLSAEKGIQLNQTDLIELLVTERYSELLKGLEKECR